MLSRPSIATRRGVVLAALVAGAFMVVAAQALAVRSPLGHDESVYALRSGDLLEGWSFLSGDYWRDYPAPGLPLMLSGLGRIVRVHVATARALVVLLGVGILAVTVYFGVRLKSWTVGVVGAALLAVTYGFALTSTTLLADTPGAAKLPLPKPCFLKRKPLLAAAASGKAIRRAITRLWNSSAVTLCSLPYSIAPGKIPRSISLILRDWMIFRVNWWRH